jgi:hypothetical protein
MAESMAMARVWSKRIVEPKEGRTFQRWDGQFWRWNAAHYNSIADEDIRALLWKFLRYRAILLNKAREPATPTIRTIKEALDALKAYCNLPTLAYRPPCWIGEPP